MRMGMMQCGTFVGLMAAFGSATPAAGQTCSPVQIAKLLASDGAPDDNFGFAVAVSGDAAVIGAYRDDDGGMDSGSAYIARFDGVNWTEEAKLVASDTSPDDAFGRAVAISGDVAVVGAWGTNDNGIDSGSAYVFRFDGSTWNQEAELVASDPAAGDFFGNAVAIDGDTIVVGSVWDDDNGSKSGSAYIFHYDGTTWSQQAKLVAPDGAMNDWFGSSVAISNGVALIGARFHAHGTASKGSAYIFRASGSTWVFEDELLAGDGSASDNFGQSVAISNDVALIGAYADDDDGNLSGSAYTFRYNGTDWMPESKLTASDASAGQQFGYSVSIAGFTALIGTNTDSGSAYVFRFDGSSWSEESKLVAADGAAGDFFGHSVSVSVDTALVGAFGDGDLGAGSGSAYVFDLNCLPDCLPDVNADGMLTSADFSAWIATFNAGAPLCDQNLDGVCDPSDFAAWIANFNAGCSK